MKSKISYFMEKDTRLILDNLSKVIINENLLLINYTLKNKETIVVRYIKNKNRLFIYDKLKKYSFNIYEAFIKWAEENKINWYSVKEVL